MFFCNFSVSKFYKKLDFFFRAAAELRMRPLPPARPPPPQTNSHLFLPLKVLQDCCRPSNVHLSVFSSLVETLTGGGDDDLKEFIEPVKELDFIPTEEVRNKVTAFFIIRVCEMDFWSRHTMAMDDVKL